MKKYTYQYGCGDHVGKIDIWARSPIIAARKARSGLGIMYCMFSGDVRLKRVYARRTGKARR